jgi:hypothetical protein
VSLGKLDLLKSPAELINEGCIELSLDTSF